ncbi:MAG: hypothetical protein P1V81_07810 [Planctomycetota bacterium]|nr:hypothetical protein [Planctomycetota bacterium]
MTCLTEMPPRSVVAAAPGGAGSWHGSTIGWVLNWNWVGPVGQEQSPPGPPVKTITSPVTPS